MLVVSTESCIRTYQEPLQLNIICYQKGNYAGQNYSETAARSCLNNSAFKALAENQYSVFLSHKECPIGKGPYAIKMISEGTVMLNIAHLFH